MQTASDAHFKKNQKGQIGDILKDKFGLFQKPEEGVAAKHYERKPLYTNASPIQERLTNKFLMREQLRTRRGTLLTVISPERAQTLSLVDYLDRNVEEHMSETVEVTEYDNEEVSNQTLSEVLSKNHSFQRISGTSKSQFQKVILRKMSVAQNQAKKIPETERFVVLDSEFIDQHQVHFQNNKLIPLNNPPGSNLFDNKQTNRSVRELSLNKESI